MRATTVTKPSNRFSNGQEGGEIGNSLSVQEIIEQAKEVKRTQSHFCSSALHQCNGFLDNVLRGLGIELSWLRAKLPSLAEISQSLAACDRDWQRVWPTSKDSFQNFREEPGDICIWDKVIVTEASGKGHSQLRISRLAHAGILDGKGELLSACEHEDLPSFDGSWRLMCHSPSFGTPTAIFRYRKIKGRP